MRPATLIVRLRPWAALALLVVLVRPADAQDAAGLEGNWFVTWEGFPEGGATPAALTLHKPWDRACRPQPGREGCVWIARRRDEGSWSLTGRWGPGYSKSYYGPSSLSVGPGGTLSIEQPYFVLGHWGGQSEVRPVGPGGMIGRWTYGDQVGVERWTKAEPVVRRVKFDSDSVIEVSAGEPGTVYDEFHGFWWGPDNDMRGNRPAFWVTVYGENLWGHHVFNFRHETGLEPTSQRHVRSDSEGLGYPENVVGLSVRIVIWPGVSAGRKVLWLDDTPIPFDLVVEGLETEPIDMPITDPITAG